MGYAVSIVTRSAEAPNHPGKPGGERIFPPWACPRGLLAFALLIGFDFIEKRKQISASNQFNTPLIQKRYHLE